MELEKILENENGKVYLDYEYLKGKILKKYPNLVEVKYIGGTDYDFQYIEMMFIDKEIIASDNEHTYKKYAAKSYETYGSSNEIFSYRAYSNSSDVVLFEKKASIIIKDDSYSYLNGRMSLRISAEPFYTLNGIKKEEFDKFLANIIYRLSKTRQEEISKVKNKYKLLRNKIQNNEALSETELEFISVIMDKSENIETGYQTILKMSLERNRKWD